MIRDLTTQAKRTDFIIQEQMQDPIFSKLKPNIYDSVKPYVRRNFGIQENFNLYSQKNQA